MLNKIILLNSGKYQKAIITFDREAIQICGNNNVGKTSLISVLNFLYLPSAKDWNFDHNPVPTLKYYFEKPDKSYILFEIFTGGYFCILARRDNNNKLAYYKIQSSYEEFQGNFFKQKDNDKALLDFESISSNMIGKIDRLDMQKFKELLYGQSKKDKTVLWLKKDTTQKSFNKIYKHLLNTKSIDDKAVKESLLVADGKHNIFREFTYSDNQKITDVKRHQKGINALEDVKLKFGDFKDIVGEYNAKKNILNVDYQSFYNLYNKEIQSNKDNLSNLDTEEEQLNQRTEKADDERTKIATELGKLDEKLRSQIDKCDEKGQKIDKIEQCSELFLKAELKRSQTEHDKLSYALSQIKNENYTIEKIKDLISKQETENKGLRANIDNFDNLLIHHIAEDKETKERVNNLLKDEVLKLDKSKIIKPIQNANNQVLDIFDGKIDISSIKKEKFTTIDALETQLNNGNKNFQKYKDIQGNIKNQQQTKDKIKALDESITKLKGQIEEIENLSTSKKELTSLEGEQEKLKGSIEALKQSNNDLDKEFDKIKEEKEARTTKYKKYTDRKSELMIYYTRFEDDIKGFQVKNNEKYDILIDKLVEKIKTSKKVIDNTKRNKDEQFINLKEKLNKEHADEVEFIQEIEDEIASIDNKKNVIKGLIESITHDISQPTRDFLTKLKDFKGYITSLNTKFKQYKISNLNTIEINIKTNPDLERDLEHIADIDANSLFIEETNNKIQILLKYIEDERTFHLSDLFDFEFMINGKTANLGRQTESNGTDRMLKVILFILIMKELIIQDKDNKLIIYIDELGEVDDDNIGQLIKICKENNFVPIFASPDKKPHIDKYYDLLEMPNGGNIIVDDERAIYVN